MMQNFVAIRAGRQRIMRIKPLDQIVHTYAQNCVRSVLEGRQTLNWVCGCLRHSGANPQLIRRVILQTKGYGDANRWTQLARGVLGG